jgi:hypothetical protein
VLHESAIGRDERLVGVAATGGDQRTRPCRGREPPRPVKATAVRLELRGQLRSLVELAELDKCLDRVGVDRMHLQLSEAHRSEHRRYREESVPRSKAQFKIVLKTNGRPTTQVATVNVTVR